jgi:hypothetical protein
MNLTEPSGAILNELRGVALAPDWWYTPLLSGVFALIGILIAQGIVLYLARRTDRRRSEPELLRHCANFSAVCGQLKRELALKKPIDRDMSGVRQLEESYDALIIIGTPEIEQAAERFIGMFQIVLIAEDAGDDAEQDRALTEMFKAHTRFIDSVRKHFNRPKKAYMAMPMIQVPEIRPEQSQKKGRSSTKRP